MSKNDDRVLQLKKIIDEKKENLKSCKKTFLPITNCILDLDGQKYNLNVLQFDELQLLLVKLNIYLTSAVNLNISLMISGYSINDWIEDINNKLDVLEFRRKENELKVLENKLNKMLSDEKKTELELDEIAALLK
jgi:hypothetical protein